MSNYDIVSCMQIGDVVELNITDVAFGGDGVARLVQPASASDGEAPTGGRVVFVPLVLPGERVAGVITGMTARFARAECRRVLVSSPARVSPTCPHFGVCGGCRYQHASLTLQVQMKHKQVVDILERIGGFKAPPVEPMMSAPPAYGYRNKITLHGPGRPGFHRLGGGDLLPIESCPLACDAINRKLGELTEIRLKAGENLTMRRAASDAVFTYHTRSSHRSREKPVTETVMEVWAGLSCRVPVRSFFQVNHAVLELLLARVALLFEEQPTPSLVDAYCGVGVFALSLAGRAQSVIGLESDPAAVACAVQNAAAQGLTHAIFRRGHVENLLGRALRESIADRVCVILDPPRAGCDLKVIRLLAQERPRRIFYLSCVPPVMARDLKILCAGGYELRRVIPFDMFPQTAHVEVLADLSLPRA